MAWQLDREDSSFFLWTFKDGLMARLAHDLKIAVDDYDLQLEEEPEGRLRALRLEVKVADLRVLGAVKERRIVEGQLSPADLDDIHSKLRREVLEVGTHPTITFNARELRRGRLAGELCLKGHTRPLEVPCKLTREGQSLRCTGKVRFRQSDFGLKPFRAFLGAIKLKDEVEASFDLRLAPASEASPSPYEKS